MTAAQLAAAATGLPKTTQPAAVTSGNEPSTDTWKFEIGEMVSHKDHPLPSLVMDRVRTSKGKEIYGIRSFAFNDERRDRMILGDYLVAMGDGHPAWKDCLLFGTGLVPSAGRLGTRP